MATHHVDPVNGADANAGTSSAAPLRSFRHALAKAIAEGSDAVVQATSSATNPIRIFRIDPTIAGGGTNLAQAITAAIRIRVPRGTSGVGAYVTTGLDISEGVSRGNLLINSGFQQWIDADNIMHWTKNVGTETHVRESTIVNNGTYSLKVDNGGATAFGGCEQSLYLPKNCQFQFSYTAYMATAARYVVAKVWDRSASVGSNFWEWVGQVWGADDADVQLNTSTVGAWETESGLFTTQNSGRHTFKFATSGGTATISYYDQVSVTNVTHPTYAWVADTTEGVYYLPCLHFRPYRVLVCAQSAWESLGMEAFATEDRTNYSMRSTLTLCRAAEKRAFWDSTNDRLYVHLPSGMTPDDVHIEALPVGGAISIDDDVTVAGVGVTGTNGVLVAAGASIPSAASIYGVKAIGCAASFIMSAGTTNLYNCQSYNTSWAESGTTEFVTEGDYLSLVSGTVVNAYGCTAVRSCDDGFQADSSGEMHAYGCLARDGGTNSANTDAHAFKIGNTGANVGHFHYCTAINYVGHGFRSSAASTITSGAEFTADNCMASGNGGQDFSIPTPDNALNLTNTVTGNIGGSYLASGSGGDGSWEGDATNLSVQDADFTSVGINSDGSIQSDSPGIDTGDAFGVGNVWTAGEAPYSAAFGPFPSRKLNKGADQR